MSVTAAFALVLLTSGQPSAGQPAPAVVPPPAASDTTVLDEIVVEGRSLDRFVRDFVNEIAAPARKRGLARWHDRICVGAVNWSPQAAQFIVDRVSQHALDVGLEPGDPGCKANIVVVASDDGAGLASAMVRDQPRAFNTGSNRTDLGPRALAAFQTDRRAVRWWQTSVPIDSETGDRAVRLTGDINPSTGQPLAPVINTFAASRIQSQIRDDMNKSIIIVDVDEAQGATLEQLADYVSMVALAQIDASADVGAYPSILKLFSGAEAPSGMTDWDMTYLKALYATHPPRLNPGSQVSAVTQMVVDSRRDAAAQDVAD